MPSLPAEKTDPTGVSLPESGGQGAPSGGQIRDGWVLVVAWFLACLGFLGLLALLHVTGS